MQLLSFGVSAAFLTNRFAGYSSQLFLESPLILPSFLFSLIVIFLVLEAKGLYFVLQNSHVFAEKVKPRSLL
jgi:hypothetical protein